MPVTAPKPQQPNPIEIQSWQQGRTNAIQAYDQSSARAAYMKGQATNAYGIQNRQAGFNNRLQRQGFDDPYIGRGILNSAIRGQGLTNMYQQQANDFANRQQQYAGTMGGYDLEQQLAMQGRDTTLSNLALQEQARRAQLAAEIKGIV